MTYDGYPLSRKGQVPDVNHEAVTVPVMTKLYNVVLVMLYQSRPWRNYNEQRSGILITSEKELGRCNGHILDFIMPCKDRKILYGFPQKLDTVNRTMV